MLLFISVWVSIRCICDQDCSNFCWCRAQETHLKTKWNRFYATCHWQHGGWWLILLPHSKMVTVQISSNPSGAILRGVSMFSLFMHGFSSHSLEPCNFRSIGDPVRCEYDPAVDYCAEVLWDDLIMMRCCRDFLLYMLLIHASRPHTTYSIHFINVWPPSVSL